MTTEKQQIIDLKFVTFYNYFNKNFNYGFSNPKTDICDLCFQVIQEGVSNLESTLKEEYEMHLEKVSSHKAYKHKILKNDSNVLQLEMDFVTQNEYLNCQITLIIIAVQLISTYLILLSIILIKNICFISWKGNS